MKKIDRKGFTLIELLAVLVILGLLVALAVPNVTGVVRRQRNSTYVEDAKRLVTRLKTMFAANPDLKTDGDTIDNNNNMCYSLLFLDNGDFEQGPNNGYYLRNQSYVKYDGNNGKYYVTLIECVSCKTKTEADQMQAGTAWNSSDIRGVKLTEFPKLTTDKPESLVVAEGLNDASLATSQVSGCNHMYFDPDQPFRNP